MFQDWNHLNTYAIVDNIRDLTKPVNSMKRSNEKDHIKDMKKLLLDFQDIAANEILLMEYLPRSKQWKKVNMFPIINYKFARK